MSTKLRNWIYFLPLPLLHLAACATIKLADIESGVHYMIIVDFPISLLIVALGWRHDNFLFWFATLGTLWWCLLSGLVFFIFSIRKMF